MTVPSTGRSRASGRSAKCTSSRASPSSRSTPTRSASLHRQGKIRGPVHRHVRPRRSAWKVLVNNFTQRKESIPNSKTKVRRGHGHDRGHRHGRLQLQHATKAALPSHRFPGEPGWYWSQGQRGTVEDKFTIAELISSGMNTSRQRRAPRLERRARSTDGSGPFVHWGVAHREALALSRALSGRGRRVPSRSAGRTRW